MTDPGLRAVLADDGRELVLTVYGHRGALASVSLLPRRALQLAEQLLVAVLRRSDRA